MKKESKYVIELKTLSSNKKEEQILIDFLNSNYERKALFMMHIRKLKEGKIIFTSYNELKDRILLIKSLPFGSSIERYKAIYGDILGIKKYEEYRCKNSQKNSGKNNPMYKISVKQRFINKYGKIDGIKKYIEWQKNAARKGSQNGAFGKTNKELLYNAWKNNGLTENECNEKYEKQNIEIGLKVSGEKNGMYGKPAPEQSGYGINGWINGLHFRSLLELSYIIYLEDNNIDYVSAENKIKIKYYDNKKNQLKNYHPDFIINKNEIIEIKPKNLYRNNKEKFKAAKRWAKDNNFKYKVITPEYVSDEKIYYMWKNNLITLSEKSLLRMQDKFNKIGNLK